MAGNQTHPTWAEIDAVRTGEGDPKHREHVDGCASCQAALAELKRLATDLRLAASPSVEVPADIDARILWNARKRAQVARKATRPVRRLVGRRWAVAAAMVIALGAVGLWERARVAPVHVARIADDIDGNGKIDIRDAFMLAKAIDSEQTDPRWDIDGNDSVDTDDVDHLARTAVAIRRKG